MAVGADSADEEVDASSLLDLALIVGAFLVEVLGVAVEDVDVLLGAVHMVEEVARHERMVALGVGLGQAHIFVHVERDDIPERQAAFLASLGQAGIHALRGGSCGETENEGMVLCGLKGVDALDDVIGCPF